MATVVSTPVLSYRASPIGGSAIGQSANMTVAISVPGWESHVPFVGAQPNTANISAGWEMYAYRSSDGGATYETIATFGLAISRNPNINDRKNISLPTGYWLLRVISGGGSASTFSFSIGTVEDVSAIQNI